jgi:glycosyltransferase involved in cell wall biosynthesis
MGRKGRILCFTSYYLPGFKSGGPLRSLLHLQEWLRDEHEFWLVTRNRDLGDDRPYERLVTSKWCPVGDAKVWYLSAPHWSPGPIRKAFRESQPDLLYFHSSFDFCLTIMPLILRRFGWLPRGIPVLIAPRGEFSAGARSIKQLKKNVFLFVAKALDLYGNVTWQATKDEEATQIRALWGSQVRVAVAPNLPSRIFTEAPSGRQPKQAGALRLVFLSRISRMKNLHGALELLRGVSASVTFDIYGTREDPGYWDECSQLIGKLPGNISATYRGVAPPEAVLTTLAGYDALLLPTLGENFGHVILEALLAGCPVVLSDQTPWRNLATSQAGFDIALDQPCQFQQVIEGFAAMEHPEFEGWTAGARAYGLRYSSNPELVQLTRGMLKTAMTPWR